MRLAASLAAVAVTLSASSAALADEMIIRRPGAHTNYLLDIEPHGVTNDNIDFIGPGARFTLILVDNGFVKSINNNVGIGIGADLFHSKNVDVLFIPVVMQWNFFLSQNWSVFGEPGIAFWANDDGVHRTKRGDSRDWLFIAGGGRYHFSKSLALTMRAGVSRYNLLNVGVSIFL